MLLFSLYNKNYNTIADSILNSFERDLADFTANNKAMNKDYLIAAKIANINLKIVMASDHTRSEDATAQLCQAVCLLKSEINLLKESAQQNGIQVLFLGDCYYMLSVYKIEEALFYLRKALPYYVGNKHKMRNVVGEFFERITQRVNEISLLYNLQNKTFDKLKEKREDVYKQICRYVSQISEEGKLIYAKTNKSDEYTVWKNTDG